VSEMTKDSKNNAQANGFSGSFGAGCPDETISIL